MSDTTSTPPRDNPAALTRAATVVIDRAALQQRAAEDPADDRIPIAISSEHEVARYDWWEGERYLEVLDHSADAVDLSRAAEGLPLLLDHSTRDQVGLVEEITVDKDRRLRGLARFSKSARGQEVRQDMLDGIRKNISVGYAVGEDYEQEKRGDTLVRRYRKWTPYEVSSVPIPADPTVGVGRAMPPASAAAPSPAAEAKEFRMSEKDKAADPAANVEVRERAAAPTHDSATQIRDMAEAAGLTVREARELEEAHRNGKSLREISAQLIEQVKGRRETVVPQAKVDLSRADQRRYSLVRALDVMATPGAKRDGLEFEISEEIARQHGRSTPGLFFPTSLAAQREDGAAAPNVRTQLSVGTATKGAEAKFTEYGGFIDLLRNRMVTTTMGAQYMGGLVGDVSFPNQSAAGTFSWGNETTAASLSSLTLSSRTFSPKVGSSSTSITRQLLRQSSPDIENIVRNDLAAVHAIGIDSAAINGTGTSSQPTGVRNVSGIGSVVGGTNGLQPTYDNVVDLQREVAIDNAMAGNLGYVVSPLIAARLMKTQQFSGTNGVPIWTGSMLDGQVAGFRALASTQVPTGLTKGTSTDCSPILFGDWSALYILEWGSMELIVDPYTLGANLIRLNTIQMIDVFVRYPEKFAVMADARI